MAVLSDRPATCRVCDSPDTVRLGPCDTASLMACRDCGFRFRDPLPSAEELSAWYARGYYEHRAGVATSESRRDGLMRGLVAKVRRYVPAGRLLDVGAARGQFVRLARAQGLDASGVEFSADDARAAVDRGLPVVEGDFAAMGLDDGAYDAVTLFDVIEHLPDPVGALRRAAGVLKPGAYLFVITGNTDAPRAQRQGVRWHYYHMPGHVSFFSRAGLVRALGRAGFGVDDVEESLSDGRLDRTIGRTRSGWLRGWLNRYAPGLKRRIKSALGRTRLGTRTGGESVFVVAHRVAGAAGTHGAVDACHCGEHRYRGVIDDRVVRCVACGLARNHPLPYTDETGTPLYQTAETVCLDQDRVDRMTRARMWLLDLVRGLRPSGRLLDVGCSFGFFVHLANQAGYQACGVDVNPDKVRVGRDRFGIELTTDSLDALAEQGQTYDIVTLTAVLEHVSRPVALLRSVRRVLARDGVAVITTPNLRGFWHYRRWPTLTGTTDRWLHPEQHLWHFEPAGLARVCRQAGFEDVRIVPRPGYRHDLLGTGHAASRAVRRVWLKLSEIGHCVPEICAVATCEC